MAKTSLKIEGMMCEGCVKTVKEALEGVPGVESAEVDLKRGTAAVRQEGVPDEALVRAVVDAGFRASVKRGLFRCRRGSSASAACPAPPARTA